MRQHGDGSCRSWHSAGTNSLMSSSTVLFPANFVWGQQDSDTFNGILQRCRAQSEMDGLWVDQFCV